MHVCIHVSIVYTSACVHVFMYVCNEYLVNRGVLFWVLSRVTSNACSKEKEDIIFNVQALESYKFTYMYKFQCCQSKVVSNL